MTPERLRSSATSRPEEEAEPALEFDLERLLAMARRQALTFLAACVIGLTLGIVYILTAVPLFTATTHVLIDSRSTRAMEDVSGVAAFGNDTAAVDSQVEVIRSEQIGMRVVERLDLHRNPAFMSSGADLVGTTVSILRATLDPRQWFGGDDVVEDEELERRRAMRRVQESMQVRRVGRTHVLEVAFTSSDRQLSARIANAVAEAYLTDQLESKYEATRRASDWLQQRIAELQQNSREADMAVQRFRAENNLIAAGNRLVSEQQLTEINSQLILAQAETARTRARYDRIQEILASGQTDAIVGEALQQQVFNTLRGRYLDAAKRHADLSARLGNAHVQVVNLRAEMQQYETLIFEELRRIAESYLSDYEVALSREESLRRSLDGALGVTAAANETLVSLRELESQAASVRMLLDNFQRRFQEAVQQQSFPIAEARVITRAAAPENPSHPRKMLVLALALVLGAASGAGVGLLREYSDRVFRTGQQVREELGLEFLGMLPAVDLPNIRSPQIVGDREFAAPPIMRYVVDQPLSGYAETLRAAKVAVDVSLQEEQSRIIGVVSMLPGEGKSTTAKNFASLLASQGAKTLLIDSDLRNPGLTRALAPKAEGGLVEVLMQGRPVSETVLHEPRSGVYFLPAVLKTRITHTSDLMASPAMRALLREAAQNFDYVVVDCPPLGPVVDVRAAAGLFDGFLFVVEWGKTPRKAVRMTLQTEERIASRCLGVVLNKVDKNKLGRYENTSSKEYYYGRYSSYYRT